MKTKIKMRKNSQPFKLLRAVAMTGAIVVALSSPFGANKILAEALKHYISNKVIKRQRFLRDLKSLQDRKLIDYRELTDGRIEMTITRRGKNAMLNFRFDEMQLKKSRKWDRRWRLVMFDIPHSQKNARDALRGKLKNLGFYQLQKSVFITPHPCEDEIDFLGEVFEVRRHILILYVDHFEGEEKFFHYFSLI